MWSSKVTTATIKAPVPAEPPTRPTRPTVTTTTSTNTTSAAFYTSSPPSPPPQCTLLPPLCSRRRVALNPIHTPPTSFALADCSLSQLNLHPKSAPPPRVTKSPSPFAVRAAYSTRTLDATPTAAPTAATGQRDQRDKQQLPADQHVQHTTTPTTHTTHTNDTTSTSPPTTHTRPGRSNSAKSARTANKKNAAAASNTTVDSGAAGLGDPNRTAGAGDCAGRRFSDSRSVTGSASVTSLHAVPQTARAHIESLLVPAPEILASLKTTTAPRRRATTAGTTTTASTRFSSSAQHYPPSSYRAAAKSIIQHHRPPPEPPSIQPPLNLVAALLGESSNGSQAKGGSRRRRNGGKGHSTRAASSTPPDRRPSYGRPAYGHPTTTASETDLNAPVNIRDIVSKCEDASMSWSLQFWVTIADPLTHHVFFACPASGQCSWEPPVGAFVVPRSSDGEWWELADPSRGNQSYYYNTLTGVTQWERPGEHAFVIPLGLIQRNALPAQRETQQTQQQHQMHDEEEGQGEEDTATASASASTPSGTELRTGNGTKTLTTLAALGPETSPSTRTATTTNTTTATAAAETLTTTAATTDTNHPSTASTSTVRFASNHTSPSSSTPPPPNGLIHISTHDDTDNTLSQSEPVQTLVAPNSSGLLPPIQDMSPPPEAPPSDVDESNFNPPSSPEHGRSLGWWERRKARTKHQPNGSPVKTSPGKPVRPVEISPVLGTNDAATMFHTPPTSPIPVEDHPSPSNNHLSPSSVSLIFQPSSPTSANYEHHNFSTEDFADRYFATKRSGVLRQRLSLEQIMEWQRNPITAPLLVLSKQSVQDSLVTFKVIQHVMGERDRAVDGARNSSVIPQTTSVLSLRSTRDERDEKTMILEEIRWMIQLGVGRVEMRDELYCQLIKQLTRNPDKDATVLGFQLFCVFVAAFGPSKSFEPFVRSFLVANVERSDFGIGIMSKFCLTRLDTWGQKGGRGRVLTIAEIEHASDAAFYPSVYGQTLETIMQRQEGAYPELRIPIILPFLADGILALGGTEAEGIFRVPGDNDVIAHLKTRIDRGQYQLDGVEDPHVVASLFKLWLRELEEPLVPSNLYNGALQVAKSVDHTILFIKKLPDHNRRVLLFVISFMQLFLDPEVVAVTKMTPQNLALILAPNVLRTSSDSLVTVFANSSFESQFVLNLLLHLDPPTVDPEYVPMHGAGGVLSERDSFDSAASFVSGSHEQAGSADQAMDEETMVA